jgi:hypothetical protein
VSGLVQLEENSMTRGNGIKDENAGYVSANNNYSHWILYAGKEWDVTGSKMKVHEVNGNGDVVDWQTAFYNLWKALKNRAGKVSLTACEGERK